MPKGYWIAMVRVTDPEAWQRYVEAARPAFEAHGGRFIARGGTALEVESPLDRPRNVICEFPSLAAAKACYDSETYQAARKHREGAGVASITLVEGID
jgi:uncharacterized protein (DUF1330 family)